MWSINLLKNEPKISKACAHDLFEASVDDYWESLESVTEGDNIHFDCDHYEYMDCLTSNDALVAVLCKHKVRGDICFGSEEGDNAGQYWGWRFDGKGGVKTLDGKVDFEERESSIAGKTFVLTGALASMTREEAGNRIRALGGKVAGSVSAATDYIVIGKKPGSKAEKARDRGIPALSERKLLAMLKENG